MPTSDPIRPYISRRLTSVDKNGRTHVLEDTALLKQTPPIVILGEPGMGKTRFLEHLAECQPDLQFVRAAALVRNPSRVSPEQVLLIDALDEVAALQEGDPLHNVLRALGEIHYPPFILSCRAADWRSAVAKIDISEDYATATEEWVLQPLTKNEALRFLSDSGVGPERAADLIQKLDDNNLAGLFGNPLTLRLLADVASMREYSLPKTRAALFGQATDVLRREVNPRYTETQIANLPKEHALDAAGAISATLLLTGNDAVAEGTILEGGGATTLKLLISKR